MKFLYPLFLLALVSTSAIGQYSVCTDVSMMGANLAVSINTSTANANISVMIGEDLNSRDFSIGFTNDVNEADIILRCDVESDLKIVKSRLSEANLSVVYSEKRINPDVRIEVVENGTVDFLIYYGLETFDIESLILSMLPIINASIGYKYDAIPYWGPEGGPADEEEIQYQTIEPILYEGINIARWITGINEGVILLNDNSTFYVYDEDRYISNLWAEKNDVVVTPTEVPGHYYITKDGGIYKDPETLRAICFKMK